MEKTFNERLKDATLEASFGANSICGINDLVDLAEEARDALCEVCGKNKFPYEDLCYLCKYRKEQ